MGKHGRAEDGRDGSRFAVAHARARLTGFVSPPVVFQESVAHATVAWFRSAWLLAGSVHVMFFSQRTGENHVADAHDTAEV